MIWIERNFEFDLPVEMFPNVLERLRGAPARLEEKVAGLSDVRLKQKPGEKWSLQEHAGHLSDCFVLWDGRLGDYEEGLDELRPADVTGSFTNDMNHNSANIADILKKFRTNRAKLVARFEKFGIEGAGQSAHHPRLNKPMRVIDLAFFIAEHDDHHLTVMTGMLRP